jgi:glycosyltransferase involved in cell wall biosynthesis
MKVLYIITKSERGGAQIHALDLIRMLRETAEPILACGDDGFLTEEVRKLGVEVHILPDLVHPIRPLRDARAVMAAVLLIRRIRPDILHSHTAKAGLISRIAGMLTRTPTLYTVHSWSFVGSKSVAMRSVAVWLERTMRLCGGTVIDVCRSNFEMARERKVVNARNHVAIWNGMPDTDEQSTHDGTGPIQLLMSARFVEQKDHETLVRALAGVDGDWRLILAGDGPKRPNIEALVQRLGLRARVEFPGNTDQIPTLLAQSDIFVLSTCYESLPLSIIEGMRAGLPVVATDVGGIRELVSDGVTGHLVPRADPESLRGILNRLIGCAESRRRMGELGRARYERDFRLETMFGSVLSLYGDLARSGPLPRYQRLCA